MDMGADAPASMPTQATEIYHEGLQIPPVKLYVKGELQRDLLSVIARNSRTPDMMTGDLLSLSSAGKIAEKRVHELCEKFSGEAVLETFAILFQRAHDTMAKLIKLLPEEPIVFEDYMDNDGLNDVPLTIKATITRQGDRVTIDYTGTSPQTEGPVNYPVNASMEKMGLYNMLRLAAGDRVAIDPELDPNQGIEDLVDVIIPEGSLISPEYPAPVSLRHLTLGRVDEVVQGCLAQVFPEVVPATHNGSLNCYSMLGRGRDPKDRWLCFEVMAAGSGGRAAIDGIDAFSWNTRLKNAPAEFVETVYPVMIEQYSLRPGSGGPGKQRGGYGLIRAIRALRPAKLYFLDERHKTQPWGLYGGRAAQPNDAWLVRADGELIKLPSKFDDLKLDPGDMFVMRTGGGGGWGDPFERDPAQVQRDVKVGLLTVDQARDLYGVIVDSDTFELDETATTHLRDSTEPILEWIDRGMPVDSPDPGEFRHVTERPYPWLVVPEAPAEGSLATVKGATGSPG